MPNTWTELPVANLSHGSARWCGVHKWQGDFYAAVFREGISGPTASKMKVYKWDDDLSLWIEQTSVDCSATPVLVAPDPEDPYLYFHHGNDTVIIGNKMYWFSAQHAFKGDFTKAYRGYIHTYDLETGEWDFNIGLSTPLMDGFTDEPVRDCAVFLVGTDVHFFGGGGPANSSNRCDDHHVYHSTTNTWTELAAPSAPLVAERPGFITRKIDGGEYRYHWITARVVNTGDSDPRHWEWDGDSASSWIEREAYPHQYTGYNLTGVSFGKDKILGIGGYNGSSGHRRVNIWDEAADAWTYMGEMPVGSSQMYHHQPASCHYIKDGLLHSVYTSAHWRYNEPANLPEPIPTSLILLPETAVTPIGDDHTVTATVLDEDDEPMEGIPITFEVEGPNDGAAGSGDTDAIGEEPFTYSGDNPGLDTITASTGGITPPLMVSATLEPSATLAVSDGIDEGPELSDEATNLVSIIGRGRLGRASARLVP